MDEVFEGAGVGSSMNESTKERLFELARRERQLSQSLYAAPTRTLSSNSDAIRAEIARLMANFYGAVGVGGCVDCAYTDLLVAAKAAARQYNERQQRMFAAKDSQTWRQGLAGYYSEDEAETKCRHALLMVQMVLGGGYGNKLTNTLDGS